MDINISNSALSDRVLLPTYNRKKLKSRIVHLGFGAFHRAHQALYTNELLHRTNSDWGICEISLLSNAPLFEHLRAQDHLYTIAEKGADTTALQVIGAVCESRHPALDGVEAILEKMAESQVAIVSMTITEKGYCIDPLSGTLDRNAPNIRHDIDNPTKPKSALGYIVQALRLRMVRKLPAFTVLSCDNLRENGRVASAAILEYANLVDPELGSWIAENVSFPCTMVDRIVPAASEETLVEIADLLGVFDPCAIATEPFRQWVIEDNFVAGRPDWNLAGAEFVADVIPYEEMKLRMLNGTHSFLAYLGYLGGYEYISDTMRDPNYRKAAFDMMMKAQAPSLSVPVGTNLERYANMLIERFSNPSLKHRTWQIAMDGSQKIPQRMSNSLMFHLANRSDFSWIATGIAGWMRYVSGVDEKGNAIDVRDPMAQLLCSISAKHGQRTSVVPELLAIETIFPSEIGKSPKVIEAVSKAYQSLIDNGAQTTVASL
ncbi:fructuronate reductase [Enterovibrio sp. ZSDZ35]|uniref:Fructuronate reductase n=1 Tax=Enterovibrio qingdaonensis TaxID=2899818 RepID=A0ABT5QHZ2_9GAMM|nr:fructuronate reductase [Enterovibrio sp. ZSDZ35]MDD1780605.1 fructuronate reductase [Enterovibrio sp. ZSDZ35]